MSKLCVRKKVPTEGDRRRHNKKQEPHTKMWGINTCGRLSAPSMLNIPPVHMNIRHLLGSVMGSDFMFERKRLPPGRWIPLERFFDFLWAWGPSSKL